MDTVFRAPDESGHMRQDRRLSLANIFKGGAHLVRRMPSLLIVTVISALIEPLLPDRATFDRSLGRSSWDSLTGMAGEAGIPLTALAIGLVVFQALLVCWFTKGAFEVEEGRVASAAELARFVARFTWITLLIYAFFIGVAFLFAYLLSVLVFPVFPIAEKVLFVATGAAVLPFSTMLHAFSAYWTYAKPTLTGAIGAVASSIRAYGLKGYAFFAFSIGLRLAGVAVWYAVLSSPIYYPVRLVLAAIVLAMTTMFLRGIRFEFQHLSEGARRGGRGA